MKFIVVMTLAVLAVGCVSAQTRDDYKIVNLPGLEVQPSFDMYSGYITLDDGVKLFFWMHESQSNPSTDPLILWLNGGPGCSSLLGMMMENGPFQAGPGGDTLVEYPWSWNSRANIVFLESPAFVGFSYWPEHDKFGHGEDNKTAHYNYEFLEKFISVFTEYQNRPFVITGESYAGHYIPEVMDLLIANPIPGLNFQGVAIGNPSLDDAIDQGEGLELYRRTHFLKTLSGEGGNNPKGIDPYNILGSTCDYTQALFPNINNGFQWGVRPYDYAMELLEKQHEGYVPNPLPDCVANGYTKAYLNRADVQAAIHAEVSEWAGPCSYPVFLTWRGRLPSTIPLIVNAVNNTDLTIWIYSGDQDTVCNGISTEEIVLGLGRPQVGKYVTWLYEQTKEGTQVGGFQLTLDRLTFRSVRGAGHEVPRIQPAAGLQLLDDFLAAVAKEHN